MAASEVERGACDGVLDGARIDDYLRRLELHHRPAPDLAGLALLHERHLERVPFENLSIHWGEPIVLEARALVDKLTRGTRGVGRGGFCYELNGAFGALLDALGFRVTRFEARVDSTDGVDVPFDHLCLGVALDERYLVDVGFGDSFVRPLRLDDEAPQADRAGTFEVRQRPDGWRELVRDGARSFRFALTPRRLADFEPGCRHHCTSPASPFTRAALCSRPTPTGRITVRGTQWIETTPAGRIERALEPSDVPRVLREAFGLERRS